MYLGSAEALIDCLCGLDRGAVDAPIEEEHDEHGQKEAAQRRVDDVARVVGQLARPVAAMGQVGAVARLARVDLPVVPADQRREADDEAEEPHDGEQHLGPQRRHDGRVRHGPRDGQVPVQADGAQVQNGRGAHPDVDGEPHGAPDLAEDPQVEHLERGAERQHGHANGQVGHGERHDEQVGHGAQLRVEEDGEHHETVAEQHEHVDHAEDHERHDEARLRPVHLFERVAAVGARRAHRRPRRRRRRLVERGVGRRGRGRRDARARRHRVVQQVLHDHHLVECCAQGVIFL